MRHCIPGWWFGTFDIFPYISINHPNGLRCSEGLKPPTRFPLHSKASEFYRGVCCWEESGTLRVPCKRMCSARPVSAGCLKHVQAKQTVSNISLNLYLYIYIYIYMIIHIYIYICVYIFLLSILVYPDLE